MEWISVKDRLPQKYSNVLIYTSFGYVTNGMWVPYKNIFVYDRGYELEKDEVTHWMPLPEPPEED